MRGIASAAALALAVTSLTGLWPASAEERECSGRKDAYSADKKVKPAKRKAGIEQARQEAFFDLAARAWSTGALEEIASMVRTPVDVDIRRVERLRSLTRTNELLRRGVYEEVGDRKSLYVRYCVPQSVFEEAVRRLAEEREDEIRHYRRELAEVERALLGDDLRWAAGRIAELGTAIQTHYLDYALYESPITGEQHTFLEWIDRWSELLKREGQFVGDLFFEAQALVEQAHLSQAEQILDRIERIQPTHVPSRSLRRTIDELREERRDELYQALHLAEVGKFRAAARRIENAREIDLDDIASLRQASEEIAVKRAEYFVYNPRWKIGGIIGAGTLGFDAGAAADRLTEATGDTYLSDLTIVFGLDFDVRLGRLFQWHSMVAAGSSASTEDPGAGGFELPLSYLDVTTGLGFRTVRNQRRRFAFAMTAGVAYESVDIRNLSVDGLDVSDSRTGGFVRMQLEGQTFGFFVQHGFGFEDDQPDPTSLHVWTDELQFGVSITFGRGSSPRRGR